MIKVLLLFTIIVSMHTNALVLFARTSFDSAMIPIELKCTNPTVGDLRREIELQMDPSGELGCLSFGGTPLVDACTPLADFGISAECVVDVNTHKIITFELKTSISSQDVSCMLPIGPLTNEKALNIIKGQIKDHDMYDGRYAGVSIDQLVVYLRIDAGTGKVTHVRLLKKTENHLGTYYYNHPGDLTNDTMIDGKRINDCFEVEA